MQLHLLSRRTSWFGLPLLLVALATSLESQEKFPKSWENDSTLRSVFFTDYDFGWAVGDKGTILKTEDGGRTWSSISSPRDVIWTQVYFADAETGWVAGGHYRGPLDRSVGVLIKTEDGGRSWKNISQSGISLIKQIRFDDRQRGWMLCDSNPLYPSGLLMTSDGGQSWRQPKAAIRTKEKLKSLDPFRDGVENSLAITESGKLITGSGRIASTVPHPHADHVIALGKTPQNFISPDSIPENSGSESSDFKASHSSQAVCFGQSQLLTWSDSKWSECQLPGFLSQTCWKAKCQLGSKIWIGGSPGSTIAYSSDGGTTWQFRRTGQQLPIEGIFFVDEHRGWAVGALGRILVTKDGGVTWRTQRNPESRLGVLNLVTNDQWISYDGLALLGGSFGHLSGTIVLQQESNFTGHEHRVTQAVNRTGASVHEVLKPVKPGFLRQLVQTLRTWRPSVVVIHDQDLVMQRWIQRAIEVAADSSQFPELSESGLTPWTVQKLVSVQSDDGRHVVAIDQFSAVLGRTVSLQSRFAQLLGASHSHPRSGKKLFWNELANHRPVSTSSQGLTAGTNARTDPACNRVKTEYQIDNMQQIRSISNWENSLSRLGRMMIHSPIDEKSWLENVTASTSGLDELSYAFFLEDLADHYTRLKNPLMADHTERLILHKVGLTEVGEKSLWKLIQRYCSRESNFQINQALAAQMAREYQGKYVDPKVQPASTDLPWEPQKSQRFRESLNSVAEVDVTRGSLANAAQLIELFQNRFPEVSARRDVEFELARLKFKTGNGSAMMRLLDLTHEQNLNSPQAIRLSREKNIGKPDGIVLGSQMMLDATQERVRLDGELSESFWNSATPWSDGEVRFAMDDEYLYFAMRKQRPADDPVRPLRRVVRDGPLAEFDRVSIAIDFDRDYCSAVQFTVDVRGACQDSIWRDRWTKDLTFDPTWYFSSQHRTEKLANGSTRSAADSTVESGKKVWTVEAAIPRSSLDVGVIRPDSAWIVNVQFLQAGEPELASPFYSQQAKDSVLVFHQTDSAKSDSE